PNLPNGSNILLSVAAVSADDVWAVGFGFHQGNPLFQTLVEHWDGSAWSIVPSPSPGVTGSVFWGVTALGPGDVRRVGYQLDTAQPLTEPGNGTAWAVVPSPSPPNGGDRLHSVAAVNVGDLWAVGGADSLSLTEHYSGLCVTPTVTASAVPSATPT